MSASPDMTLGRLTLVPDLRSVWPSEASDFTPWLASEANIELLGNAIGMELGVERVEAPVGPFRADILCRDLRTGYPVLVENQLERTDHTHLGQLFTYASGLDAASVVWIASRFTDEHRAALEWLNRITHDEFSFFGIEVELWQIGASAVAPRLNVVVKPNGWSRAIREAASASLAAPTPTQEFQRAFWHTFAAVTAERGGPIRPVTPAARSYMDLSIGRTGVTLGAAVRKSEYAREGSASVYLWFYNDPTGTILGQLDARRGEIEAAIGQPLEWQRKEGKKSSTLRATYDYAEPTPERWPAIHAWMIETLEAFDRVFRPMVATLDMTPVMWEDASDAPD